MICVQVSRMFVFAAKLLYQLRNRLASCQIQHRDGIVCHVTVASTCMFAFGVLVHDNHVQGIERYW
jgi:hypothetical protein